MSSCVVRVIAQFLPSYGGDFGQKQDLTLWHGRCLSHENIENSFEHRWTSAKLSESIVQVQSNAFDVSKPM